MELEEIKAAQLFTVCPGISSEGAGCPIKNSRVSNKIIAVFTICSFADQLFQQRNCCQESQFCARAQFRGRDLMEVMFPIPVPGSHSNSGSVLSNDHTVDFTTEKVEHQRKSKRR